MKNCGGGAGFASFLFGWKWKFLPRLEWKVDSEGRNEIVSTFGRLLGRLKEFDEGRRKRKRDVFIGRVSRYFLSVFLDKVM